jgi:thiol-disulfide isomerase/thioredoxin
MVKTLSSMLPLGTQAPDFSLPDVTTGKHINLHKTQTTEPRLATVVLFICNHCPYVKHVNHELKRLADDYIPQQVRFIAINSNNIDDYPDDAPEHMKKIAAEHGYPFPYVFDETQEVAKAYQAACTPDFFVFDETLQLIYRGQLDDSRPGNGLATTGHSIRTALNHVIQKTPLTEAQKPSMGCNIKWKK